TFQGDRSVLNNEFQNVLSEINRQAQSIGMTQGGQFAQKMQVFIGGGRNDATNTTAASAILNGSVSVDLSSSLLDTNSLGLSSNGVQGVNVLSSQAALSTALGQANPIFNFSGNGFSGVAVTVPTANWNTTTITDQNALVAQLNTAIATAASQNSAFAAANVHASIDPSSGKLTFSSTQAFAVQEGGAAAQTLMGDTNVHFSAASSVANVAYSTLTAGDTLTFTYRDSSGTMQSATASLASGLALATAVSQINQTSNMGGIYAVANATAGYITFMKADGGAFQLSSVEAGATGIATGILGSSNSLAGTTALDISNSSDATSAVTALKNAVGNLGQIQGTVGRAENQLGYAINLAQSQNTNLAASEAQIRDADMAAEAASLTKAQILVQAGTAALAQANSAPQAVLALLKG
ncbi:MAG TPA: flagellin, partial [Bryobacteraceae bacterium]|nr:flagellin [Bryobacteraceae bacterium]